MTVEELITFLSQYDDDCFVQMMKCADGNPLDDDVAIRDAVAIESAKNLTYIVLIPE